MPNFGRNSPVPVEDEAVIDIPDLEEVNATPEDTATVPTTPPSAPAESTGDGARTPPDSILRAVFNAFRDRAPAFRRTRTPSPLLTPPFIPTPPSPPSPIAASILFIWSANPPSPPPSSPSPVLGAAAMAFLPPRTMNLKYPKYASAPHQDPDDHCIMFEETYYLNNPPANPAEH